MTMKEIKRAQSPNRKAQGDRDFKATPQEWSEERYSATQRQHSVVMYISESGAVSAEYEYDPFGKVTSHTGMDFDFQFSTKFHDPDIDMYYYGYRYYSPELRRWASPDPIGEAGGLNLYGFCGNDGVNDFDETGLSSTVPVTHSLEISSKSEDRVSSAFEAGGILIGNSIIGRQSEPKTQKEIRVLFNNYEHHVWDCFEFNGKGNKDEYIKHLRNVSFKDIAIPVSLRSLMAYNLVSKLTMDQFPDACWSIDFWPLTVVRTASREKDNTCPSSYRWMLEFKISVEVVNYEKHPTCCEKPKHRMPISGKIELEPITHRGGCAK